MKRIAHTATRPGLAAAPGYNTATLTWEETSEGGKGKPSRHELHALDLTPDMLPFLEYAIGVLKKCPRS